MDLLEYLAERMKALGPSAHNGSNVNGCANNEDGKDFVCMNMALEALRNVIKANPGRSYFCKINFFIVNFSF